MKINNELFNELTWINQRYLIKDTTDIFDKHIESIIKSIENDPTNAYYNQSIQEKIIKNEIKLYKINQNSILTNGLIIYFEKDNINDLLNDHPLLSKGPKDNIYFVTEEDDDFIYSKDLLQSKEEAPHQVITAFINKINKKDA